MRFTFTSSIAAIAMLAAPPAIAQEEEPPVDIVYKDSGAEEQVDEAKLEEFAAMMSGLFQTEPLTAEQEARLPAATAVVSAMMPDGFYSKMMGDMMDKMMRPMMSMFTAPEFVLGTRLAVEPGTIESLSEDEQRELLAILDPAHDQRLDAILDALTGNMGGMFAQLEPPMRDGLSKAYAVRFDEAQLADIATFFETPTGSIYARESMALFADPQVMQATMQSLPAMMSGFTDMGAAIETAIADLPKERALEDLSGSEQSRMAELLGVETETLGEIVMPPKSDDSTMGSDDKVSNLLLTDPAG